MKRHGVSVGGCVGGAVGTAVGSGTTQVPPAQFPLPQSTSITHDLDSPHPGQLPPQSTSVSSPLSLSSVQPTSVGLGVGAGVGFGVGLGTGNVVGPGVESGSVGAGVGTRVGRADMVGAAVGCAYMV